MSLSRRLLSAALIVLAAAGSVPAAAQPRLTLDAVRERGHVICGVDEAAPGLAAVDANGAWSGLDADLCRAIAVAALGDASKVRFRPLMPGERYAVLKQGEVDLLARAGNWTMSLEIEQGLRVAGVSFFDGSGVLVRRDLAVTSALELSGVRICLHTSGSAETSVARFWRARGMPYEVVGFERTEDALAAYDGGRCSIYVAPLAGLEGDRMKLAVPEDHAVLPDAISQDPLGPVVRQGDEQWLSIVRWSLYALIHAEEVGLTSQNIDQWIEAKSPAAREFADPAPGAQSLLGISPDWAYRVVKTIGNYGEVFERNLGKNSPLGLPRGLNNLWSRGGLIYAPTLR